MTGVPAGTPVSAPAWSTDLDAGETAALLRTFSDYVWKADGEGRLATDMPQWRQITGQSPEELLGFGWIEGVHPDDRDRVMDVWMAAVEARAVYDVQYRITGPGGERWYHARAAPVLDDRGAPAKWVGTVNDVTVERHRETLAAQQRELLDQVIAQAPVAVAVTWGPEQEFRWFNDRYLALVPARDLASGMTVSEAFPEAEQVLPVLEAVRLGTPYVFDELAVPFDGPGSFQGHRYYQGSYLPVSDGDGPGGVLCAAVEITDQVRRREDLQEQLRHERQAAERLQRALLPDEPPAIDGLDVALVYLPAGEHVGVGGDWYDVLPVGAGRVLLVIGDVAGRGMQAAAWMSQMRAAVRAYARQDPSPARVLAECSALADAVPMAELVTVGCGLLDLGTGELQWASAGHPPPLLLRPGAPARLVEHHPGPPLGAGVADYRTARLVVDQGQALVLYTDGAVEDRRHSLDDGLTALLAAAPNPAAGAQAVVDGLAGHVATRDGEDDDVALLVVRRG